MRTIGAISPQQRRLALWLVHRQEMSRCVIIAASRSTPFRIVINGESSSAIHQPRRRGAGPRRPRRGHPTGSFRTALTPAVLHAEVMRSSPDEVAERADGLLYGGRMWQVIAAAYPGRAGELFADGMNAVEKRRFEHAFRGRLHAAPTLLIRGADLPAAMTVPARDRDAGLPVLKERSQRRRPRSTTG